LTLARNESVLYWDFGTGKLETMFTLPGNVLGIAWHPEGKLLAVVSDKNAIHIWNVNSGQWQSELQGHHGAGVACAFSHVGDVLVSNSWDGTIRLWDPWTGHQLLNSDQGGLHLGRDDRLMGGYAGRIVGLWEVALGRECRKLAASIEVGKGPWSVDFSPDLPLLASAHEDGVRLWDLRTWKELA